MWGLGVITFMLLAGYPPFYGKSDAELVANIRAANYKLNKQRWKNVSSHEQPDNDKLVAETTDKTPRHRAFKWCCPLC